MRVKKVELFELDKAVDVYDIEVLDNNNFLLEAGVFVHNSKDIADCIASICWLAISENLILSTLESVSLHSLKPISQKYVKPMVTLDVFNTPSVITSKNRYDNKKTALRNIKNSF